MHNSADARVTCSLCPHACRLAAGATGFCRARRNEGGTIRAINYGRLTALALDPIEKKPLYHFYPNSQILSVGSFGCNLACPFCQNAGIAAADERIETENVTPAQLAALADELRRQPRGNIGVAFTYNEPLVGYEYIMDTAPLLHAAGMKVVLVTNGMICTEPLTRLLPHVDAMNIDLKAWHTDTYRQLGGNLAAVKSTIATAVTHGVHVEVTTLVVPGISDRAEDMDEEAYWLSTLSPDLPLHISRYFPRHRMSAPPTPIVDIDRLTAVARRHLRHVHRGNC
ncbi:AmmeMemoRadiSam system radical SAM enzyme [uncultured Selenomonas sp.]|uniref:AmmeMemoRadiSam system radical SAM enzyme n=1 Tax=uncultured Selenomonas sp. TaxID=159275 RepID=UPI0028E6C55B|nr:AmmeMemoRadiSam system radical SAM enzyme [uncultured Selenomonas sp.]